MFKYLKYLSKIVLTKIPVWFLIGIYWLMIFIFLIVIPGFTDTSPLQIWTIEVFDIKDF